MNTEFLRASNRVLRFDAHKAVICSNMYVLFTYLLAYLLTPWSRVLLEKLNIVGLKFYSLPTFALTH